MGTVVHLASYRALKQEREQFKKDLDEASQHPMLTKQSLKYDPDFFINQGMKPPVEYEDNRSILEKFFGIPKEPK